MRVLVIGSGASGVHFALTALRRGHDVTMVDGGRAPSLPPTPEGSFVDLRRLDDPIRFFLGDRLEGVVHPGSEGEYYGFPPNKQYVFERPPGFAVRARGFAPLMSFASGGLAEAWTAGAYPLNDDDLREFPIRHADLAPHYDEVATRIGVTGADDDLSRFFPTHASLSPPLRLDRHGAHLLAAYERRRIRLARALRCYVGRSRVAVLAEDRGDRRGCAYLGRCLWGCPRHALYTPALTLAECRRQPRFTHRPGLVVTHFHASPEGRIRAAVAVSAVDGVAHELPAEAFVLAAGTLSSAAIYLRSFRALAGETATLPGLMDNRQVLVPFLTWRLVGERHEPDRYQYHQLALGIEGQDPASYVHGQITTLKGALVHPIVQNVPLDLRGALFLFRHVRAGLGVVNVNLHDTRRPDCAVTLEADTPGAPGPLVIRYVPPPDEPARIHRAVGTVRRLLRALGALVPPGMTHVRPMGASVHYAGTLPMAPDGGPHTVTAHGRSRTFENLHVVDGSTMPFLPAKNLTFTLMANAVRVATAAF